MNIEPPVSVNGPPPGSPQNHALPEQDVVELFFPQPAGKREGPLRIACVLLAYALVAAGAGTLVMMYAVCFAAKGPACHAYWERLSPGRTGIGERGWSLLVAFVFTLSFISLLWALGELCTMLLDCRRSARLRTRVREVLDGVTTRSQAALKMHAGLGRVMHLVHDASLAVRLSFECISYRLSDGTYVLSDASGVVEPDEITVVMGPSGCGKSTLLSLLSGKLRPTRGTIFLNGKPGSVREMYKLIGFVPQEDVMLTSLTVMELLWFSAICRLPRDLPRATLNAWVHMVLDLLRLAQHRHKRIGDAQRRGLSGGQRKRVNVAIELVADPSLIFLDEPTSGLDSTAALELMQCLHRLSSHGVAVCAVIHQPRVAVFELAHSLLLLGGTGKTVYMGPTLQALAYFQSLGFVFSTRENVADQLLDVVSGALQSTQQDMSPLNVCWNAARQRYARDDHGLSGCGSSSGGGGVSVGVGVGVGGARAISGAPVVSSTSSSPTDRAACALAEWGVEVSPSELEGRSGGAASGSGGEARRGERGHRRHPSSGNGVGMLGKWLRDGEGPTRTDLRLKHDGGRKTARMVRQVSLFVWRSFVQLERGAVNIVRDLFIIVVAGLLLGFLFEGTLEKVRCDEGFLRPLVGRQFEDPLGRYRFNFTQAHADNWGAACREQLWEKRSWFARPAWFCASELFAPFADLFPDQALEIEVDQFMGVRMGYAQALTLSLLAMAIVSIQVSLNLFGAERPVFWRESRHFSIAAYTLGKNLAFLPLTLAYPFFFLLFFFQLLRPYAPFHAFYVVFLLVEWAGEGVGQLISLQLNASRQLAGGIAALIFTVLTGSFPLLSSLGLGFEIISYTSFCRWGMQALLSLEFTPWYVGNGGAYQDGTLPGGHGFRGCCRQSLNDTIDIFLSATPLPSTCEASCVGVHSFECTGYTGTMPTSNMSVYNVLAGAYGYVSTPLAWWYPGTSGYPDVFPLYPTPQVGDALVEPPVNYTSGDMRFSQTSLLMLLAIGVVARFLVYLTLRVSDRKKRR